MFIYKRMTYYRHGHIFDNANIRLIDNAQEIILADEKTNSAGKVFFESFNEDIYHTLSNPD